MYVVFLAGCEGARKEEHDTQISIPMATQGNGARDCIGHRFQAEIRRGEGGCHPWSRSIARFGSLVT